MELVASSHDRAVSGSGLETELSSGALISVTHSNGGAGNS